METTVLVGLKANAGHPKALPQPLGIGLRRGELAGEALLGNGYYPAEQTFWSNLMNRQNAPAFIGDVPNTVVSPGFLNPADDIQQTEWQFLRSFRATIWASLGLAHGFLPFFAASAQPRSTRLNSD
jgi:hypothetical protein